MAGNKKYPCEDYLIFGTCAHGSERCYPIQGQGEWESEYFFCEIVKVFGKLVTIKRFEGTSTSDETFFVRCSPWHRHDAAEKQVELEGQFVVFQASDARKNHRCGRIVLLLGEGKHFRRRTCEVVVSAEVEAFTVYPKKTLACRNAVSITNCSKHHGKECKKIGIHIPAMAWCLSESMKHIPSTELSKESKLVDGGGNPNLSKFLSFKLENRSLAISAYIHSSDTEDVEGPLFSPVYISQNYTPKNIDSKIREYIDLMCITFKEKNVKKILKDKHHWSFTADNELHKWRFAVGEALNLHTALVTKHFRLSDGQYAIATVAPRRPSKAIIGKLIQNEIDDENSNMECLILQDHVNEALQSDSGEAAKWVASSLQIMNFRETAEEDMRVSKYTKEVVKEDAIGDGNLVCVFGQKGVSFMVSQQILIQSMLGLPALYKKDDLLGVLVPRYPEPQLVKSLIRINDPEFLHLNYIDLLGISVNLRKLSYLEMGARVESKRQDEVKLTWENFHCDEIEYDKVLRVNAVKVGKCFSDLLSSVDANTALNQMEHVVTKAPFSISSAGELKFSPIPGMVIRMQICGASTYHPTPGFRMLRVGRHGHICLAHMNYPKRMFLSHHKPLQSLPPIKNLSEASKIKKIHLTESGRVIRWKGKYNGGGWFKTELPVKKGQLLCIRKDIYEDNKVKYVWNAHGVLDEDQTGDGEVSFSVCTLSQPGETDESDDFVIEYIDEVCE